MKLRILMFLVITMLYLSSCGPQRYRVYEIKLISGEIIQVTAARCRRMYPTQNMITCENHGTTEEDTYNSIWFKYLGDG